MSFDAKISGEIVEAKFQYLILTKNIIISRPFGDSLKYDFILDVNGTLYRTQIKSTSKIRTNGGYQVKASYGSKLSKTKYTTKDLDLLVAYITTEDTWYIIPSKELSSAAIDLFPTKTTKK